MIKDASTARDILVLLLSSLALRALAHLTYTPLWAADSDGYSWRWMTFITRDWRFYDALRTPGYCAFVGFAQWLSGSPAIVRITYAAAEVVVYLQQLAGVAATIALYLLLRNIELRRRAAFWGALVFGTLVSVSIFEMIILPLALTCHLLVCALWLFSCATRQAAPRRTRGRFAVASGLVFAATVMMRPDALVFVVIFILTGATMTLLGDRETTATRRSLLITASVTSLPVFFLLCFNAIVLGQFTLTTATGYNATSTVYNLFDRVDSQDAVFARIMMKYYRGASRIDFVNDAWHDLYAHAGEMPLKRRGPLSQNADLCAYAGAVSHRLQRRFPATFLANAVRSFDRTFIFDQGTGIKKKHVKDPESPDGKTVLRRPFGRRVTEPLRRLQCRVMLVFYCLTLVSIPAVLCGVLQRHTALNIRSAFLLQVACGTVATFAAYGFAHTYFPHYGMCMFGSIVLCGVLMCAEITGLMTMRVKDRWSGFRRGDLPE